MFDNELTLDRLAACTNLQVRLAAPPPVLVRHPLAVLPCTRLTTELA